MNIKDLDLKKAADEIRQHGKSVTCPNCHRGVMARDLTVTCPNCHKTFDINLKI